MHLFESKILLCKLRLDSDSNVTLIFFILDQAGAQDRNEVGFAKS